MKKTKILAVLGILLAMGITACNGGGGDDNSQGGEQPQSQVSEHTHEFGEWVQTKAPTCTEKGTEERTCACGEKETRNVKANGHTYVEVAIADDTETDPAHKAKAPDCVNTGIKVEVCSVCGNRKESTIPANGHTFVEVSPANDTETDPEHKAKAPTCTETGIKVEICSVCQYRQESTIRATGHTYTTEVAPADDAADLGELPEGETEADHRAKAATCTEAGIKVQYCDVCHERHEEAVAALGHDYVQEDGADKVTWTQEATCVLKGIGTKHCNRCEQDIPYEVPALDHQMKLVGGEITPEPGKAAVRLYECQRAGCGTTFMGFQANEVSEASKPHLVFTEPNADGEVGAKFWGRPIGNDIALDENGNSSSSADHTPIFNEEQPGDFFEYVFDLTAEQAATLSTCLCYCDAKPADYMASNNLDFWAASGSSDWTPGLYIDDDPATPDNEKGTQINDYRYILYVDDVVQSFDPGMKAKVPSGDPRQEYVMPFIFHLHEGTNKISLRMAGGYKSTFYNFIFRPYEGGHTHVFGDYQYDDNNHWKVCTAEGCFAAEGTKYQNKAHSWSEVNVTTPATHSSAGAGTKACTVCGKTVDIVIPKIPHEWTEGTPVANSDETPKNTTPLSCSCGKVGAKMSVDDWTSGTFGSDADKASGNLRPSQNQAIVYNIVVSKAGNYSLDFGFLCKSNGSVAMSQRNFSVKVNGVDAAVTDWGTQTPNGLKLGAETPVQLELCPTIALNAGVNTISITCAQYRLHYAGYLVVAEL